MMTALLSALQDDSETTAFDTVWAAGETASSASSGAMETVMLAQDKLYVVLAVVLIIWIGIAFFIWRTDRKLSRLERSLDEGIRSSATQNP